MIVEVELSSPHGAYGTSGALSRTPAGLSFLVRWRAKPMRRTCHGEISTISGMCDGPCGASSGKETAPPAGMTDLSIANKPQLPRIAVGGNHLCRYVIRPFVRS
jgi:hypothetical protein